MKYLSKFKINENVSVSEDISNLKNANEILKAYTDGPAWNDVIQYLNETNVDYDSWTDLEILIYYLENTNI